MDLIKVKIDSNDHMTLKYATSKAGDSGKRTLVTVECPEVPPVSLINKIKNLKTYVGEIIEIPAKQYDTLTVRGISFSFQEKSQATGVIFTALKSLDKTDSPYVINTPIKYDVSENERTLLNKSCINALDELKTEIKTWLQNVEMQLNLFEKAS